MAGIQVDTWISRVVNLTTEDYKLLQNAFVATENQMA